MWESRKLNIEQYRFIQNSSLEKHLKTLEIRPFKIKGCDLSLKTQSVHRNLWINHSLDDLRKDYFYIDTVKWKFEEKLARNDPHFARILRDLEENCDEGGSQTGRNRSQGSRTVVDSFHTMANQIARVEVRVCRSRKCRNTFYSRIN